MKVLSQILEHKIVAIVRGAQPDDVLKIADALFSGGIRILEITMNSPKAIAVIEKVAEKLGERMVIGAGTVLDSSTARTAILAGAKFILSPTLDIETIKTARRYGAVSIPGAFTPTEILKAYSSGADIVKVFPASDPAYIKNIRGPLPQIPIMPTGGVNLENIKEFQKAGAVAFGIGSSLVDTKSEINDEYLKNLTEKAAAFVYAVNKTLTL